MKITVKKLVPKSDLAAIIITPSHLSFFELLSNHDENESCALVFGNKKSNNAIVNEIVPMNEKAERSVVHFSMDPLEAFKEIEKAESKGLELVAIFHSHPGRGIPAPSGTDRTFMKYWPVIWLISNKGVKSSFVMKGYVLREDGMNVKEVPIVIENEDK